MEELEYEHREHFLEYFEIPVMVFGLILILPFIFAYRAVKFLKE